MIDDAARAAWDDALLAAALFAIAPADVGGIALRSSFSPARERWLECLRGALPQGTPWRRMPVQISEDRLLGGLDLAATLHAGRPVAQRGLLAETDGGVLVLGMAERLPESTQALLRAVLDQGEVAVEREGLTLRNAARFGVIALDEGLDGEDGEALGAALLDRLAFPVALSDPRSQSIDHELFSPERLQGARTRLPDAHISPELVEALCGTALALGVASLRSSQHAVTAARVIAAYHEQDEVDEACAATAARLVLAPRATVIPQSATPPEGEPPPPDSSSEPPPETESEPEPERKDESAPEPEPPPLPEQSQSDPDNSEPDETPLPDPADLQELLLAAAVAALPPGLLEKLRSSERQRAGGAASGRVGAIQKSASRGRPAGVRRGAPEPGVRLNLIATLRTAAPWQTVRRAERAARAPDAGVRIVEIRGDDFRITKYQQRRRTTTIFLVDASGSSALNRLAEAKGAVELLLAECYVRRDEVAVIAFRGATADVVLPPTRSLVRAKRQLAGLPGGGGTPLATAIDAGLALADAVRRRGATATLVLLTDGRANISREGRGDRKLAQEQAHVAARRVNAGRFAAMLIDTSPRAQEEARKLAELMNARYIALPYADSRALSGTLRGALAQSTADRRA